MHKCYENDIKKSHRIFWGWLWPLEVTYIFPTLLCAVFSHSVASNSLQSHWLYSPSGSSVHGDSPGKNNGVVSMPSSRGSYQPHSATCILFYLYHHGKMTILIFQLLSCVQLFATPWTVAHQVPLSMGFSQARILEWVSMFSSRGSSWSRDQTHVFCIGRWIFYHWTTREAQEKG